MDARRPNILWICRDQQRYDTLGCYGNPHVAAPNLDRLAAAGTRFANAFSQSPLCTPSRACFLTGRYPRTTRCRHNGQDIPADEVLVTKLFADAGYDCGLSGKLHLSAWGGWHAFSQLGAMLLLAVRGRDMGYTMDRTWVTVGLVDSVAVEGVDHKGSDLLPGVVDDDVVVTFFEADAFAGQALTDPDAAAAIVDQPGVGGLPQHRAGGVFGPRPCGVTLSVGS